MNDFDAIAKQILPESLRSTTITQIEQLQAQAIDGVEPRLIISPHNCDDMQSLVQLLNKYPLTILVSGGGTQLNAGGLPEHIDVLLKTTALNQVMEHEAPDLTCQCEAGITLQTLQRQLASKGQHLALDAPNPELSTIGGILATNSSGPKRLRYGTARDLVIGMQVLLANGEIARSGGRVVKNVAGYDLNKLYIGSYGTLGILTSVNFKLHPLPEQERTLLLTAKRLEDLIQTTITLNQSSLAPAAIELISNDVAKDIIGQPLSTASHRYTLAVNYEGSTIAITRQIDETRKIANRHDTQIKADLTDPEQGTFWSKIRERMHGTLTCKVSILVSQQSMYIHAVERICHEHDLQASIVAHAGNGILFIGLPVAKAAYTHQDIYIIQDIVTRLRLAASDMAGFLIIERCPTLLKPYLDIWGDVQGNFYLMQRLKQQFDPQGLFVRGRFLGGL